MRYTTLSPEERKAMMQEIGVTDVKKLFGSMEPLLKNNAIKLQNHKTEIEVTELFHAIAAKNLPISKTSCFLGAGCYNHHVPAVVESIVQRSEFLTSYTPYQPEISQGTLRAMFEFQTAICKLTGMEVANASTYDGATALAEAVSMAKSINKKQQAVQANKIHPHYLDTMSTYGHQAHTATLATLQPQDNISCIIVQYPDFHGNILNLQAIRQHADRLSALLIVVTNEIIALGLLPEPSMADIVCGDASSLGIRKNFGGSHLGIMACKASYMRQIPGRLCGKTVDKNNNEAYTLTLSAREQHIRREKATSNICTNQTLSALAFTIHLMLLGEIGLKNLARLNHKHACCLAEELNKIPGVSVINTSFFNEFVVELPIINSKLLVKRLAAKKILAGLPIAPDKILLAATELTKPQDIKTLCKALRNKFC